MQGRGEKGLLITTGTFTSGAKEEASRDGATPVDLVDGERLCDLLKRYELGVSTRLIEEVSVERVVLPGHLMARSRRHVLRSAPRGPGDKE